MKGTAVYSGLGRKAGASLASLFPATNKASAVGLPLTGDSVPRKL